MPELVVWTKLDLNRRIAKGDVDRIGELRKFKLQICDNMAPNDGVDAEVEDSIAELVPFHRSDGELIAKFAKVRLYTFKDFKPRIGEIIFFGEMGNFVSNVLGIVIVGKNIVFVEQWVVRWKNLEIGNDFVFLVVRSKSERD